MKTPLFLIAISIPCVLPVLSQEPMLTDGRPLAKHAPPATPQEEAEISKLIESMVISEKEKRTEALEEERSAKERAEARKKGDRNYDPYSQGNVPPAVLEELRGYTKARNDAFARLTGYGELAFPILAAHLDDERPSRKHWNHTFVKTIGGMCYRIIHDQLTAFPPGYGEYGLTRPGRDGRLHTKPYWDGTPYDEADGLGPWIKENRHLGFIRMRIKCLEWQLREEKKIGVIDPQGYYVHIQPLELEILKLRAASGEDVAKELERAKELFKKHPGDQVPKELMPKIPLPEVEKE